MSLGPGRSGRRNGPQVEQRNWTKGSKNTWATHNVLDKMPHTRVGKGAWHGSRKIRGLSRICPRGRDSSEGGTAWAKTRKAGRKPANVCHAPLPTLRRLLHHDERIERHHTSSAFQHGRLTNLDLPELRPGPHQGTDPPDDVDQRRGVARGRAAGPVEQRRSFERLEFGAKL